MARVSIVVAVSSLTLLAGFRLWFVDGMLRPVLIDGPSMALAFCGTHYVVPCPHCKFAFRCDAEHLPADRQLMCFNCGGAVELDAAATIHAADEVFLDRWPLLWRTAKRGEVIACRDPDGDLTVKRVAAEPRQRLGIRAGDLYDGEQMLRKSMDMLRETRLLVYDDDFRPPQTPRRWIGESSQWHPLDNGFRYVPAASAGEDFAWLSYHHQSPGTSMLSDEVTDYDCYNQGELRRALNELRDIWLEVELQLTKTGPLALTVTDGQQCFELLIDPERSAELRQDGQVVCSVAISQPFRRATWIEFGLCDGQVILAIDRRSVMRTPYLRQGTSGTSGHKLAIGAANIAMDVRHLRVWRDIYYLDPDGLSRPWQIPAAFESGEVAVLGDNQPVSVDSRNWIPAGVNTRKIVGLVYQPFWKSRR